MKKTILIFCLLFINLLIFSNVSLGDDEIEDIDISSILEASTPNVNDPLVLSSNAIVFDRKTGFILYEKNAYEKVPMASTTKIMTCILALENSNLTDLVTISKKAASIHGSTLGISSNTQMTMKDLLYGLMLRSGNDCAIAIAEHISGNVENFSNLMNQKCKELGLSNTNFVTPHGLDNDNHFTTAYELALLTNYALNNNIFKQIVSCKNYTFLVNNTSRTISNTNELLGYVSGVYGVKTGFTFKAGRCLVSACKRNDLDIIVVTLGANTKKIRTLDNKNLIEYAFSNFEYVDTYPILKENFDKYLEKLKNNIILEKTSTTPEFELSTLDNYKFPLKKTEISNLCTKLFLFNKFSPFISRHDQVGSFGIYLNNKVLYTVNVYLKNNLIENSYKYYFTYILKNFINIFSSNIY